MPHGLVFLLLMLRITALGRAWSTTAFRSTRRAPTRPLWTRQPGRLRTFSNHLYRRHRLWSSSATVNEADTEAFYEELKWIAEEIRRHDRLYYEQQPEIDDDAFDALTAREAQLCQAHPQLLQRLEKETKLGLQATRFRGRVGSVSRFVKRRHYQRMLSLENVHNTQQLLQWLERVRKKLIDADSVTFLTEPKLDGLSLSLRYDRQGHEMTLQWAATRGDGSQGQDVTAAVHAMSIPASIPLQDLTSILEIRGEIVLPKSAFLELQSNENGTAFSNARNAASGVLLRKEQDLDQESTLLRSKLRFYAYDMVSDGLRLDLFEARKRLTNLGFAPPTPVVMSVLEVPHESTWNESHIGAMLDYYEELRKHRTGEETSGWEWGDYDMDGCVHKVTDGEARMLLGESNRSPRWAIAHKFPPQAIVTELLDIEVQVGRTGALTPVAVLRPVDLGGVTVQRATLHNFQHMRQMLGGVDRIAKETPVLVRRAGDVIPQVVGRTDPGGSASRNAASISLSAPAKCPACGADTVFDAPAAARSSKEEAPGTGQVLRCGGPPLLCRPRASLALQHAFSRDALDLNGLSEARIRQLMDEGMIRMPSDVFLLAKDRARVEAIAKLEGWGPKSAQNLAMAANRIAADGVGFGRFLYSLGIRSVGVHSSSLIASVYGNVDRFLTDCDAAARATAGHETFALLREENDLTKGIGPVLVTSLESFAKKADLVDAAKALAECVRVIDAPKITTSDGDLADKADAGPLSGKKVVFTGMIAGMTRPEAQAKAIELGAKSFPNSVSKSTDLVVAGDGGGKKVEQAEKLGVKLMGANEFLQLVEDFNNKRD